MAHRNDHKKLFKVDKELIMVFLMVVTVGLIYFFVSNQLGLLNLFYLPVILGSYFFGKQHGTLSALLSVIMVFALAWFVPETFAAAPGESFSKWSNLTIWGGFLIVTGYAMGLLYEKKEAGTMALNRTYQGVITMLSSVIDSVDKYQESHSYRVSLYSEKIARSARLPETEVEEIRIAALLHDLEKIGISETALERIEKEFSAGHASGAGASSLEPGGRVMVILPLILNYHERYDGKGHHGLTGKDIPIGAKIIAVADVYDSLTTDKPDRRALTPLEAFKEILSGKGAHFDPEVVECFEQVFHSFQEKRPRLASPLKAR